MKLIGTQLPIEIVQSCSAKWDFVQGVNPTTGTNPSTPYAKWLNTTTGEEFVCYDNTTGVNRWAGSLGSTTIADDIQFDAALFQSGVVTVENGGVVNLITADTVDSTFGLEIIGRPSISGNALRWVLTMDTTDYATLGFYARKVTDHGIIMVRLCTTGTIDPPVGEDVFISYAGAPTDWTYYEIDITAMNGVFDIVFVGGYTDSSGIAISETNYSDIWLRTSP